MAKLGCNLTLNYGTYRRGDAVDLHARQIVDAIQDLGGHAIVVPGDTRRADDVRRIVDATLETFSRIDYLILNAGANWRARDLTTIPPEEWRCVLEAEIDGVFLPLHYGLPSMRAQGSGRVVILGLLHAMQMDNLTDMALDYCLGRAARTWLAVALGCAEYTAGISVNVLEPGYVTGLTFKEALRLAEADRGDMFTRGAALNSHEVARTIVYLCSEAGRHISGSIIRIPTHILPVER
jgi:NAD(P)-dependent dehydrogenase (short-subunit alcohol dehydrogenase family)